MNKEQIEFSKELSRKNKSAIIKQCIWGGENKNGCSGKIVSAHSIQRGKILSAIASKGEVYHLGMVPSGDMLEMEAVFRREGTKKFSTFNGFCGGHDKSIFQEIEDKSFSATEQQKNIYAYRAAAKELHTQCESEKYHEELLGDRVDNSDSPPHFIIFAESISRGDMVVPEYFKDFLLNNVEDTIIRKKYRNTQYNAKELGVFCDHIKSVIENGGLSSIEHQYYCFDNEYPLACSAAFTPYFDYLGREIIDEKEVVSLSSGAVDNISGLRNVMMNIFPEGGKTHILFSFAKSNLRFKKSLVDLFSCEESKIKVFISGFLLNYAENVAFSPEYIDMNFDDEDKELIRKTFSGNIFDTYSYNVAEVNFFK